MSAMEHIAHLIETRPLIALHLFAALLALAIGIAVMARRKGTVNHKMLGWTWVVLMAVVAVSSAFIRDYNLPNIAGYTPIHAFTAFVAIGLPRGILRIRRGNVVGHRQMMTRMFFGACVVAGVFTLVPGRFLGDLLWKHTLHLVH
jgi:uncharacterized membrane protein